MNIQTDRALVPANVETTRYLTVTEPVNVLVAVAKQLAEQARTVALEANRHGAYDRAARVLARAAAAIRALGPGLGPIAAVAAELEEGEKAFSVAMSAMDHKKAYSENYYARQSRDSQGRRDAVSKG